MAAQQLPSEELVSYLAEEGKDYCVTHGIVMGAKDSYHAVHHAPFTLLPTPFPKRLFAQAKEVQKDFNLLVHRVSQDHEFLKGALQSTIEVDAFTAKIYEIYEKTRKEELVQPISLGIFRSDYMLDGTNGWSENLTIKQVEINTIASSFGGLSAQMPGLHNFILDLQNGLEPSNKERLPENTSAIGMAEGFVDAWKLYGSEKAVVMMVVSENEKNRFDQRWIQHLMREIHPSARMIRKTFSDIGQTGELKDDKSLIVDGYEVAVVYFRAGYDPDNYQSEVDWNTRLMMERSRAIKCPSAAIHLAGTKKVQQVLASPGALERFISDEDMLNRIRRTFTGLFTLDEGPEGDKTVQMALADPERFVLKPQLEGGGNNIFGDDIVKTLTSTVDVKERSKFILMEKIKPPIVKNYIVRAELPKPVLADVLSEIGCFGILLNRGDEVLVNREVGHLMRTKSTAHQDGGVSSGRANLDSPYLV